MQVGKEKLRFRSAGKVYEITDEPAHLKSLILEVRELLAAKQERRNRMRLLLRSKQVLKAKLRSDYVRTILGLD